MNTAKYKVPSGKKLSLRKFATSDDGGLSKDDADARFEKLHERLIELTELLYADGRFGLLVVFQGMDTSGKDSTIRSVLGGVCPSGIDVTAFKRPSEEELRHFVSQKLAAFKVPVKILFLPETLPRNANGKIMKKDLKALFQ